MPHSFLGISLLWIEMDVHYHCIEDSRTMRKSENRRMLQTRRIHPTWTYDLWDWIKFTAKIVKSTSSPHVALSNNAALDNLFNQLKFKREFALVLRF